MRTKFFRLGGGLLIALLVLGYLPHVLYLLHRASSNGDTVVGKVIMKMQPGWFPFASSEGFFGRHVFHSSPVPTVYLFRVRGLRPWIAGEMAVSEYSPENLRANRFQEVCGSTSTQLGTVHFVCNMKSRSSFLHLPEYNIGIVPSDLALVEEIGSLTRIP